MGTPAGCRCEIVGPLGLGAVLSDGETVRAVNGAAYAVRRCPLCAAAPDLLAALTALVEDVEALYKVGRVPAETWFAARAAIRKATPTA